MGFSKRVLRGKFIAIHAYLKKQEKHQETSRKQPNFTPKATRKRTKNPKVSGRKEIIKIRTKK